MCNGGSEKGVWIITIGMNASLSNKGNSCASFYITQVVFRLSFIGSYGIDPFSVNFPFDFGRCIQNVSDDPKKRRLTDRLKSQVRTLIGIFGLLHSCSCAFGLSLRSLKTSWFVVWLSPSLRNDPHLGQALHSILDWAWRSNDEWPASSIPSRWSFCSPHAAYWN